VTEGNIEVTEEKIEVTEEMTEEMIEEEDKEHVEVEDNEIVYKPKTSNIKYLKLLSYNYNKELVFLFV
jgi:hypothetical protein